MICPECNCSILWCKYCDKRHCPCEWLICPRPMGVGAKAMKWTPPVDCFIRYPFGAPADAVERASKGE